MNDDASTHLLMLMENARSAMCAIRLNPWEDEATALLPKNPIDFGNFVHFVESLCETFRLWAIYLEKQQSHNSQDLRRAGEAINTLARECRAMWEAYKLEAGIVSRTRAI